MKNPLWLTGAALVAAISISSWSPSGQLAHAQGNTRDFVAPLVFQAAGPDAVSLQSTVDRFRAVIGGDNNASNPGPIATGRREINWDGGSPTNAATSLAGNPFAGFLVSRGALFTTTGSGFVQAPPSGLATTFGNPSYEGIFQAFSPLRLFSPIGSNITEAAFFIPGGGNTPAVTRAFGAVFTDVDQPDGSGPGGKRGNRGASTFIQFFNVAGHLLFSSVVPSSPGDGNLSFFGIVFEDARIARVRIIAGDVAPSVDDDEKRDIVVMDDFIYGEPRVVQ